MRDIDVLVTEAYDEGIVTEVIRPAAIVPEDAARAILVEMALRDVRQGGAWISAPNHWCLYDTDVAKTSDSVASRLIGTIEVAYGMPTRYEITIFRVTITSVGAGLGWTVTSLCDQALGFGGLTLASCPRAALAVPPTPFRQRA